MESEEIKPPTIYELSEVFHSQILKNSFNGGYSPEKWHTFLEECGIVHANMSKVKIVDYKKFFLAKINYGI
jgi:hypothetical protein